MKHHILFIIFIVIFIVGCNESTQGPVTTKYLREKALFKTELVKQVKSPQEFDSLESDEDVILTEYPSGNLRLKALLSRANIDSSKRKGVLVFLHGGFALGIEDVWDCDAFTDAGYIVFAPSYRGENGNDGNFELLCGEVDDAKAAIKWISKQPFVDSTQIFVFGHSIGGGISAMLSLEKDVPINICGSSGGLYNKEFYGWEDIIPFNARNAKEGKMRVLLENVPSMLRNHYAYIGKEDEGFVASISILRKIKQNRKLKFVAVEGDHFSSLEPAINHFIALMKEQ